MKKSYKITILIGIFALSIISISLNLEPVKAATRKIVYGLRSNDGLVGYWSFNGADMSGDTALDRSGRGNDGAFAAGPKIIPGAIGQGLIFDGVGSYVDVPYNSAFDFGVGNFTFMTWIRRDGVGVGGEHIIGRYGDASQPRWGLKTGGGSVQVFIVDSDGVGKDYDSGFTPTVGQWYHLAAVVDRTNNISRVYVNGVQQTTKDISGFTGNFSSASGSFQIGAVSGNYFKGGIDETRLYNKTLSAGEIQYIYDKTKQTGVGGGGTMTKSVASNNGLVGSWDFDDCDSCTTVKDRSGNNNTGTMYNAAGPTEGDLHATGKFGKGVYLDGSNDQITIPNSSSLDITGDKVTVEAWINTPEASPADYDRIVVKEVAGNVDPYTRYSLLREGGGTGKVLFAVSTGGAGSDKSVTSTAAISINTWHHLVGVYDGATVSLYIDGVFNNSAAKSGNIGSSATPLVIGADTESSIEYLNAYIDGVKVYNRALSAAEVKSSYDNGKKKFFLNISKNNFMNNGLVGYWSFNGPDMSGTTVIDRGSFGNNGTMSGSLAAKPGIVGQAMNFNGSNQFIDLGAAASLDITGDVSVGAWVNPFYLDPQYDKNAILSGRAAEISKQPYSLTISATTFQVSIHTSADWESPSVAVTNNLNEWAYFMLTRSGSTISFYKNGAFLGSSDLSGTPDSGTDGFLIGKGYYAGAAYFNGQIDELRIYNRALTVAEVKALYNSSKH